MGSEKFWADGLGGEKDKWGSKKVKADRREGR